MAAADAGDLVAIKRLIAHYEATLGNDVLAERWRERACDLGDAQELYYLAARRFAAAEVEDDAEIRHTLLVDAHDAAKRSHGSQPDHSTQLLVEQIARAVQALEK
jgi:TPR repeat protein